MKRLPRVAVSDRVKDEDGEMMDTEHRFLLNELVTPGFALALQNSALVVVKDMVCCNRKEDSQTDAIKDNSKLQPDVSMTGINGTALLRSSPSPASLGAEDPHRAGKCSMCPTGCKELQRHVHRLLGLRDCSPLWVSTPWPCYGPTQLTGV